MTKNIYDILNRRYSLFTLLASVLMIFLFAGYAAAGTVYAKLDRDRDLDNMFLSYEVMQDYNYYTSGGYDKPNAILLIDKDYELDNPGRLWVPIPSVDYEQMRKWISVISSDQNFNRSGDYFAAYILDRNGKRIGIWYSYEPYVTMKLLEGNKVFAYTPELIKNYSILSGIN